MNGKGGWSSLTAIPKPASTVVLMDQKLTHVYMTKRPKTMKFLGGFFVFPGGSVEEEDMNVIGSGHIEHWQADDSFSPSHYVAAARELFEEVGVFLGMNDDGTPVQFTKESEMTYRRLLVNGDITFLDLLKEERLRLCLNDLTYFGHRITPDSSPIRFDTRFFLAKLPAGQSPNPDMNEIDDAFWITPDEALLACKNGAMPMAPPTIASIRTIIQFLNGGPLMMPEKRCH